MHDSIGALYDEIPYPSLTFPQTHPNRLAVLAGLYGLDAAPVERCRFLELGCGDGSNLIPMALGLPTTEFVGVDLAAEPIARGQEMIRALGLRNITLQRADVRDLAQIAAPPEPFDYIVAHGVYSWVPPDAREAILTSMRRLLAPRGVAYLSYNAYPGGHLRQMVREMLRYHTAGLEDSRLVMSRAQELARLLADALPAVDELTSLRASLRVAAVRNPVVLFHDELGPVNQEFYFHEVVEQAAAHGLQYLAEAEFAEMQDQAFTPQVREVLAGIEQEQGRIGREQYLDFFKGRQFRQTLLCHQAVTLGPAPTSRDLQRYLITSPIRAVAAQPDLGPGVVEQFSVVRGATIRIDLPIAKAALLELGASNPDRLAFDDLLERAMRRLRTAGVAIPPADEARRALADILFRSYEAGLLLLHAWKPSVALVPSERPTLSPLARLQLARSDSPAVTTLLHEIVYVDDPLARMTMALLNGTRDRADLIMTMRAWLAQMAASGTAPAGISPDDITPAAVEAKLWDLARLGLFVA